MSEKKTPDDWCDQYGLQVRDPDGWRRDNTPWEQPITLPDFWSRYTASTARMVTEAQHDRITADIRAARREDDPAPTAADLNAAYTERANLVALLAQLYPSGWDYADPTTPDWPVVFIDLPTGQATWHISPDDWWIFVCVPRRHGAKWDGHTTAEKYQRVRDLIAEIEKNHPQHTAPLTEGVLLEAGAPPLQCTECYSEVHFGKRETANPAIVIAGGNGACPEHLYFNTPPLPGRTPNGIILNGG